MSSLAAASPRRIERTFGSWTRESAACLVSWKPICIAHCRPTISQGKRAFRFRGFPIYSGWRRGPAPRGCFLECA
jgi:hypothetical protein